MCNYDPRTLTWHFSPLSVPIHAFPHSRTSLQTYWHLLTLSNLLTLLPLSSFTHSRIRRIRALSKTYWPFSPLSNVKLRPIDLSFSCLTFDVQCWMLDVQKFRTLELSNFRTSSLFLAPLYAIFPPYFTVAIRFIHSRPIIVCNSLIKNKLRMFLGAFPRTFSGTESARSPCWME